MAGNTRAWAIRVFRFAAVSIYAMLRKSMANQTSNKDLAAFLRLLPKTETHLHIEGALPWELLQQLDPLQFAQHPPSWQEEFRFESFAAFEKQLLEMAFFWYTSPERYHEAAKLIFKKQLDLNVRYVETSFASGVIEFLGLDGQAVLQAIRDAVPHGLEVRVFLGIHHNGYNSRTSSIIDSACSWEGLAGFDLHGDETLPLEPWSKSLWRRAREAGKYNKVHAGELLGADFVKQVVTDLRPHRIEHGIRAAEDPDVVALLRDHSIALDVCPLSNLKLRVCPDMASHPLPLLEAGGVRCTISTDDPLVFGNSIIDEYQALSKHLGYTRTDLIRLIRNGWSVALIDDAKRQEHLGEIERLADVQAQKRGLSHAGESSTPRGIGLSPQSHKEKHNREASN